MQALADALVFAVTYISLLPDERTEFVDHDVRALESIASYLQHASPAEQDALAEAAQRAAESELASGRPRGAVVADLESWMENMFGDPWKGNRPRE